MQIVLLFWQLLWKAVYIIPQNKEKKAPSHENSDWIRDMQYDIFRPAGVQYVFKSSYRLWVCM